MGRQDHPSKQPHSDRYVPVYPDGVWYYDLVDGVLRDSIPDPAVESHINPAGPTDPTDYAGWAELLANALEDILFTVSTTTVSEAEEVWRRYCNWTDSRSIQSRAWSIATGATPTESGDAESGIDFGAVYDSLADAITDFVVAVTNAALDGLGASE